MRLDHKASCMNPLSRRGRNLLRMPTIAHPMQPTQAWCPCDTCVMLEWGALGTAQSICTLPGKHMISKPHDVLYHYKVITVPTDAERRQGDGAAGGMSLTRCREVSGSRQGQAQGKKRGRSGGWAWAGLEQEVCLTGSTQVRAIRVGLRRGPGPRVASWSGCATDCAMCLSVHARQL